MNQPKKIIDRIMYRSIKKYTFEQMEAFIIDMYTSGYKAAVGEIDPSIKTIDENAMEKAFRELLRKEFHIGEKRYVSADMERKVKDLINGNLEDFSVAELNVKIDQKRSEL